MIQLHQYAFFVSHPDGQLEPFNIQDLVCRVAQESEFTHLTFQPWILENVIESIFRHFREELHCDKIALSELIELVQNLLKEFFTSSNPPHIPSQRLDLFDIARRCGTGFELEFFAETKRFLKTKEPQQENNVIQITGLRRCSKYLAGRQRWCKTCSRTRDEIVAYIRRQASQSGIPNLSIAVLS